MTLFGLALDTEVLVGAVASLALVVAAVLGVFLWRIHGAVRGLRGHVARMEADLLALQQTVFRLDASEFDAAERHAVVEARLQLLTRQQEQLKLRDTNTAPYLNAIRDAQAGADIDRLMSVHGLNRGEAELIASLHGASTARAPSASSGAAE
jgi:hypothetical protein